MMNKIFKTITVALVIPMLNMSANCMHVVMDNNSINYFNNNSFIKNSKVNYLNNDSFIINDYPNDDIFASNYSRKSYNNNVANNYSIINNSQLEKINTLNFTNQDFIDANSELKEVIVYKVSNDNNILNDPGFLDKVLKANDMEYPLLFLNENDMRRLGIENYNIKKMFSNISKLRISICDAINDKIDPILRANDNDFDAKTRDTLEQAKDDLNRILYTLNSNQFNENIYNLLAHYSNFLEANNQSMLNDSLVDSAINNSIINNSFSRNVLEASNFNLLDNGNDAINFNDRKNNSINNNVADIGYNEYNDFRLLNNENAVNNRINQNNARNAINNNRKNINRDDRSNLEKDILNMPKSFKTILKDFKTAIRNNKKNDITTNLKLIKRYLFNEKYNNLPILLENADENVLQTINELLSMEYVKNNIICNEEQLKTTLEANINFITTTDLYGTFGKNDFEKFKNVLFALTNEILKIYFDEFNLLENAINTLPVYYLDDNEIVSDIVEKLNNIIEETTYSLKASQDNIMIRSNELFNKAVEYKETEDKKNEIRTY